MFWTMAFVWVASYFAGRYLRDRPVKLEQSKPGAIDPDQMPTVSESRAIPMIWGTVKLRSLNVLWYGHHYTASVYSLTGRSIPGYYHYLSVAYGLCSGEIDSVVEAAWDDLTPEPTYHASTPVLDTIRYFGDVTSTTALFGGMEQEGGIRGELRCYHGGIPQAPDDVLAVYLNREIPGWPGVAWIMAWQGSNTPTGYPGSFCIGMSPILHPMSVTVRRVDHANPLELTGGTHDIDGDANPANIIWDILTNTNTALGLTAEDGLDRASFETAAGTLFAEGFGLSMILNDAGKAGEVIEEVLRHIDGVRVTNASTGLMELRLIRDDYNPDDLPSLGEDQIRSLSFQRPSLDATANMVRVTYTDEADHYSERVVTLQNSASIQAQGQIIVEDVSFPAVTKTALAQRLVAREARAISFPAARLSLTADRSAWELRQGSPFKVSWPPLGIVGMVCRVTRITPGSLTKGDVQIEAMEDVFGASWTGYGPIPPSGWEDPYQPA